MKRIVILLLLSLSQLAEARDTVVFWLSIDGLRSSYLEQGRTPRITELRKRSLFSRKLSPTFPSITFPSHCSQATGVKVEDHGIPFNSFYDSRTGKVESYPGDAALLTAEPIWQTVKREGLRSAVFNWPLSFQQTGSFKADYFNEAYEKQLTDEARIDRALAVWEKDLAAQKKLQLIMAYIVGPDSVAHKFGPEDPRVMNVVGEVDRLVGRIQDRLRELGEKNKDTDFYLLLTTDHGMLTVKSAVNFNLLTETDPRSKVRLLPGGPVGHVFLNELSLKERSKQKAAILKAVRKHSFARIYEREKLPPEWGYAHPTRVGDLVIVLDPGYAFIQGGSKVVVAAQEVSGPLGMHGYDPRESPEMFGHMLLWRYPEISTSREITGPVDSLRLHPTVAKLLKVNPSSKAKAPPLEELKHFDN